MGAKPHGLPPQCKYDHGGPFYTHDQVRAMNAAFAVRMLAARRHGMEHFTLGIIVDKTPMVPTMFHREYDSLIGSSAAVCLDAHNAHYLPGSTIPTMGTRK